MRKTVELTSPEMPSMPSDDMSSFSLSSIPGFTRICATVPYISQFLSFLLAACPSTSLPNKRLPPARLLLQPDPQRRLADDLVCEVRVGGVEAAAAHVAVETLELVR